MDVIVTGSPGHDYIMDFPSKFADRIMPDKIHKISLSFLVDTLRKNFGGTASNMAYTLKLLGLDPMIISSAGNDFPSYKEHFRAHHIKTNFVSEHKDVTTGAYFVITDQEDNQVGTFYKGAIKYAKQLSLQRLLQQHFQEDLLQRAVFCVISPTDPVAMKQYVKECRNLKLPYIYDPAFQIDHFSVKVLTEGIEGSQILIGNDYEIALIEKKLKISHTQLLKLTPIVVTTLGNKGSVIEYNAPLPAQVGLPPLILRGGEGELSVGDDQIKKNPVESSKKQFIKPAKPKNTSDPTGVDDAYRAGFLAVYMRGFDLKTCGQMGSVAAVYTVEKYGTQTHTFTKKEFKKRYLENFGITLSL